jgi:hypothetical protein
MTASLARYGPSRSSARCRLAPGGADAGVTGHCGGTTMAGILPAVA